MSDTWLQLPDNNKYTIVFRPHYLDVEFDHENKIVYVKSALEPNNSTQFGLLAELIDERFIEND